MLCTIYAASSKQQALRLTLGFFLPFLLVGSAVALTIGFKPFQAVVGGVDLIVHVEDAEQTVKSTDAIRAKLSVTAGLSSVDIVGVETSCSCLQFQEPLPIRVEPFSRATFGLLINAGELAPGSKFNFVVKVITNKAMHESELRIHVLP